MSFRGISLEPIHKNIQVRLNQLKEQHSFATGSENNAFGFGVQSIGGKENYLELSKKTVWYSLRSNSLYLGISNTPTSPKFSKLGPHWDNAEFIGKEGPGFIGPTKKGMPTWKTRTARPDFNFTPPPGVESISVTTKGSMGSIKTADIKLKIFHPDDLEYIEYAYLMPGITLFLEWGWSGQTPIPQDEYEGMKGKSSKMLEEAIIKKKLGLGAGDTIVLANQSDQTDEDIKSLNPGQYDGMLGVVTKFNWSLDTDGGYTATISIISPNSLVMGVQLESSQLGATKTTGYELKDGEYKKKTIAKAGEVKIATTKVSISDGEFLTRLVTKMLNDAGERPKLSPVEDDGTARMEKAIEVNKKIIVQWEEIIEQQKQYHYGSYTHQDGVDADARAAKAKKKIEEIEAANKRMEERLKEKGDQTTEGKTTENLNPTETYAIEGDNKTFIYFSKSPIIETLPEMKYFEKEGNIFGKKQRKCRFLVADPDGKYTRNGDPVTYSWQSSAGELHNKLSEGAVLAARGWIRKDGDDGHTTNDYVSWRWIEDTLLNLCAPREGGGFGEPVISLNSTFIGTDGSDEKYYSNQCINHPCIMSMDPHICMLTDKQSDAHFDRVKDMLTIAEEIGVELDADEKPFNAEVAANFKDINKYAFDDIVKGEGRFFTNNIKESEITQFGNYSSGNIRDILVNTKHVISVLNSQRSFEGFVTTLLADINDACGNPWDFALQANESDSHVLQVVDKNYVMGAKTQKRELNPFLDGVKSLSSKKGEILEPSSISKHYRFKGIGSGNILKTVSMASKLPKAVASMAFISNKNPSLNTGDKTANSFNIYGDQIIDGFYSGNLGKKSKSPGRLKADFIEKKANLILDWSTTFANQFMQTPERKDSLSPRQAQKQIVNNLVFGSKLHLAENMKENAVAAPRLLPLELSLTLDGISGIYQGNSLTMDVVEDGGVLPNRYKDKVLFQITKVSNGISDSGWTTTLTCMMRMIPQKERPLPLFAKIGVEIKG